MNGAEQLARALEDEGVNTLFGYPGGAILPFYDALYKSPMRHILCRHEQGAVLSADGYARATGRVGVCVATSGPGATNLVTGISNAFLDSVPVVCITGQVATHALGTDAFQEVDVLGMTMPFVKHSWLVRDPAEFYRIGRQAMHIARSGRPGPVLIDCPKDMLWAETQALPYLPRPGLVPDSPEPADLARARELLSAAKNPLVYGGGGIGMGGAVEAFRTFVEAGQFPTVLTLKGLGALPTGHPLLIGMLGMHGGRDANLAVQACDLLICVGARFDDRVTGKLAEFAPLAKVIHLDIDPAEVGKRRQPDAPVIGVLTESLAALTETRAGTEITRSPVVPRARPDGVEAPDFLARLSDAALATDADTIVVSDVGQHQMWVAQYMGFRHPSHHLTSGGLGTMGYGLPAAIGAALGRPDARVINVSGDGGILMNIQELATIARYSLPVKVIVVDNHALGLVRQWQTLFLEQRFSETDLSDNPDFARVAEAFSIPAIRVDRPEQVDGAIHRLLTDDGPLLVHVVIDTEAKVWPFVPPGQSNSNMMEEP
jgi:acetolactate synthase I/II/III large subunit